MPSQYFMDVIESANEVSDAVPGGAAHISKRRHHCFVSDDGVLSSLRGGFLCLGHNGIVSATAI